MDEKIKKRIVVASTDLKEGCLMCDDEAIKTMAKDMNIIDGEFYCPNCQTMYYVGPVKTSDAIRECIETDLELNFYDSSTNKYISLKEVLPKKEQSISYEEMKKIVGIIEVIKKSDDLYELRNIKKIKSIVTDGFTAEIHADYDNIMYGNDKGEIVIKLTIYSTYMYGLVSIYENDELIKSKKPVSFSISSINSASEENYLMFIVNGKFEACLTTDDHINLKYGLPSTYTYTKASDFKIYSEEKVKKLEMN